MNANNPMSPEIRILMLEDDPSDAKLIELALLGAGTAFVSERVDTREGFVQALDEFKPDIVLADYKLPSFDGLSAVKIVQETHPEVPVVMVTGVLGDETAVELLKAGAKDYILKDRMGRLASAISGTLSMEKEIRKRKLAETKYRTLFAEARDGIVLLDGSTGKVVDCNPEFERMSGMTLDDLKGQEIGSVCPGQFKEVSRQKFLEVVHTSMGTTFELSLQKPNGEIIPAEVTTSVMQFDGQGYVQGIVRDISGRKHAEEALQLAALVYFNSTEGMVVTDAGNDIIAINPSFTEMTGYTLEDVTGKNPRILKSGRHDNEFYQAMWHALNTSGTWRGEIWNRRKNGEIFPAWLAINTILNEDGSVHRRVSLFSDMSEKKKSEEVIWKQANFDELTGLPNRRRVYDRLDQLIKKSRRTGLPLALLLLDLDRFKEVNDALGHDMGDSLLNEAARRMLSCVRETDTVGRLGGDEFIILLSDLVDVDSVGRVAINILDKLAAPYRLGEEMAYISASIGITLYPGDAADVVALFKNADQAMYAAKSQGRNRFNYFTPSMQMAADIHMQTVNDLHTALSEDQFRVYYQPIVELATGVIQKAEAFIRWEHPIRGLLSSADFIAIAEETGLIIEIGDWVFRQVAAQTARCRANSHPEFQISVNTSPDQYRAESKMHTTWFDCLKEFNLPGQSIVVEITEGILMQSREKISSQLLAYHNNGMQVALDDFGTGASSLPYLKKFNIDYLKIDSSFVGNLSPASKELTLCEAMIAMAHKLGIMVIAEGVETQEQYALLKHIGCNYGQGYLWSRPLPAEDFEKLLKKTQASASG
ncbi:MAG: EAL domain-containing protein [Methylococcales bacterium]|nr:EAL domain-containing protein [Methylococcales bacterium]